jgi:hypothetical protein
VRELGEERMSENSQRVKTRNCKRLWRKSIKRILKREITGVLQWLRSFAGGAGM